MNATETSIPKCARCGKEDRTDEYCADCRKHHKQLAETLLSNLESRVQEWNEPATHVFEDFILGADDIHIRRWVEVRRPGPGRINGGDFLYYRTDGWGNLDEVSRWDAVEWVAFYMEKIGA